MQDLQVVENGKPKRKRAQHDGYRSGDSRFSGRKPLFVRNPSDSSEMNYADNEADEDTNTSHRNSPSTQLSTNDSDIFSENFESDSYLSSAGNSQFPPPPADLLGPQQLFYNNANDSNPLLSTNLVVSMPTPAQARKNRFHPNQYLVDYQYSSDHSEVDSVNSQVERRVPHQDGGLNDLELSALSSVEEEEQGEDAELLISSPATRRVNHHHNLRHDDGKPPKHPQQKRTSKRSRNKSLTKRRNRDLDRHRGTAQQPLVVRTVDVVSDDVTTPTTQSSDVTTTSGRDESVIDR